MNEDILTKINKELKIDINEASFISMKCRNKLLKMFCEEFQVDLDISNYQNVDLEIKEDYTILYREDVYTSREAISNIKELEERFSKFQERAEHLIQKKEIDFQNKSNWKNISNLIIIICLILGMIGIGILVIHSFLIGDYFNCIWFLLFIVPAIIPRMKDSLSTRFVQAKNYLKSLFQKK